VLLDGQFELRVLDDPTRTEIVTGQCPSAGRQLLFFAADVGAPTRSSYVSAARHDPEQDDRVPAQGAAGDGTFGLGVLVRP
jgi:hypothetical protein